TRRLGLLRRGILVTETWPGQALDRLLPQLPDAERGELLAALATFVGRRHAAGFRDGHLDLRNLLAPPCSSGPAWDIVKIDSPRHRIVRPGSADDRRAAADRARLSGSLAGLGLSLA